MTEKILKTKKNGMPGLILTFLILVAALASLIVGIAFTEADNMFVVGTVLAVVGGVVLCIGWLPFLGLKVLKPEEALVLTLFGKYIGTLKGPGFYAVNPFCTAINPAANTKLNQSGDVNTVEESITVKGTTNTITIVTKKLSLKSKSYKKYVGLGIRTWEKNS